MSNTLEQNRKQNFQFVRHSLTAKQNFAAWFILLGTLFLFAHSYSPLAKVGSNDALSLTSLTASGAAAGVLNNAFGDAVASVNGSGAVTWASAEVGGYGALPDASAPKLSSASSLLAATIWRGHYLDATGFYNLGARVYDPQSGRFLSPDPLGHGSSTSLYDYANGDPVNGLDPDGRFGKSVLNTPAYSSPEMPQNWRLNMSESDAQELAYGSPTAGQVLTATVSLVANVAISPITSVAGDITTAGFGADRQYGYNMPVSGWDRLRAGASLALDVLPVIDEAKFAGTAARGGIEGLDAFDAGVNAPIRGADYLAVMGRHLERLGYDQANTSRILQSVKNDDQVVIVGENMQRVNAVSNMVNKAGGRAVTYSPRNWTGLSRNSLEANRSWIRYWGKDKGATILDIGRQPTIRRGGPSPFYGIENRSLNKWNIYTPFGN